MHGSFDSFKFYLGLFYERQVVGGGSRQCKGGVNDLVYTRSTKYVSDTYSEAR